MTHEGIVSGYEQWMRSWDASEATIDARLTLIRARLKEWGLPGLDREHVEAFLANPAWSRWTKATYHGHLKNFCEYLVAAGYLGESPMSDVRSVRRPHGLPKPLSPVQMALALDRATTHHDGRLHDWITLGRRAGLRCHEIAKIQGEHLTSRGLYVLGKGGKEAILPIHPDIAAIAARRPAAGYWFPSPYGGPVSPHTLSNLVSEFFDTLGIEGSIHRTRHNFGTDLIEAGVDLRTVQELMRHASLATTQVYTLVSGERLASAIAKLTAA